MRIFYLCPDSATPSGGVKQLYRHVELLREEGFNAYIMHSVSGFKLDWFDSQVPIVYSADSPYLASTDVMVIPEGLTDFAQVMKRLKPLSFKKVVAALNPLYIFDGMPVGEDWKEYGIEWVMAGAKTIEELIRWSMGISNVYTVGISVDYDMFYYRPELKKLQVAYMGRKDLHSDVVERVVKCANPALNNLEFIKIENLNVNDYAQILRQSEVFLATSIHEGIHVSVLEAMASGCICIGYHGIGAKDFIVGSGEGQNFVLAESANFIDLAKKLTELVEMLKQKERKVEAIRQNGFSTAAGYSAEFEKKTLLQFWKAFFEAQG